MNKNNIPQTEKRKTILTMVVEDGVDTALALNLTGEQIKKIEDLIESVLDEYHKGA